MGEKGWRFATAEDKDAPGEQVTKDPIAGHEGYTHLRDIYFQVDDEYKGRFTVPTLYDVKQGKIVSNESSEIIRMFYTEVNRSAIVWWTKLIFAVLVRRYHRREIQDRRPLPQRLAKGYRGIQRMDLQRH